MASPGMKALAFSFGASFTLTLTILFYLEMWK